MIEKKFRAWDKETHMMTSNIYLRSLYTTGFTLNINDCEWMQFTGLQDKEGTDVYEGDILESRYGPLNSKCHHVVIFEDGAFIAQNPDKGMDHDNYDYFGCSEIIGNIHENPELLQSA